MPRKLCKSFTFFLIFISVSFLAFAGCIFYARQPAVTNPDMISPRIHIIPVKELSSDSHKNTLTVVTYNIGYASGEKNNQPQKLTKQEVLHNLNTMVALLKDVDADIIALQEVDFSASRTHGIAQWHYLAEKLGMPYAATVVTWNKKYVPWPYWPPQAHFGRILSGQAVLSRYPILKQQHLVFDKPPDNPFWYNWFYLDRIAQKLTLQIGEKNITVWNIHLEAFSEKTRVQQMKLLADRISAEKDVAHIVLGDFNAEVLAEIFSKTRLVSATDPAGPQPTFPSTSPKEQLDHILHDPEFKLKGSGSAQLTASDHLPLWAELQTNP